MPPQACSCLRLLADCYCGCVGIPFTRGLPAVVPNACQCGLRALFRQEEGGGQQGVPAPGCYLACCSPSLPWFAGVLSVLSLTRRQTPVPSKEAISRGSSGTLSGVVTAAQRHAAGRPDDAGAADRPAPIVSPPGWGHKPDAAGCRRRSGRRWPPLLTAALHITAPSDQRSGLQSHIKSSPA